MGKTEKSEKNTPMLEQYRTMKERYPNYILFFRLGDFFEMFDRDAEEVSKELELTLTSRAGVPMCGVPHHSALSYIKRLIETGNSESYLAVSRCGRGHAG